MAPRGARIVASAALVLIGLALALFYSLLLAIADCGAGCVARGERLVPIVLIATGIGLTAAGTLLAQLGARRASGWGLSLTGLGTALSSIWLWSQGSRGPTTWVIVAGIVVMLVGGVMRRRDAARA